MDVGFQPDKNDTKKKEEKFKLNLKSSAHNYNVIRKSIFFVTSFQVK